MTQPNFQGWDPGRFIKTLWFFDAIPFLKGCPLLQQWLGDGDRPSPTVQSPQSFLEMATQTVIDFSQDTFTQVSIWGALDDVVMGGVSQSRAQAGEGALVFTGDVSTANSGGFSSIRTRNFEQPLNVLGWVGVELHVRGDGNRYKLFIRGEERWDGVAHAHSFDTTAGEWQTIRLPFQEFVAVFRAKTVNDRPLDPSKIYAFQLMLSKFEYDGALNPRFTPGAFRLEVRSLAVYR